MDPLPRLKGDLQKEDVSTRHKGLKLLTQISRFLGPDRTKNELFPILESHIFSETGDGDDILPDASHFSVLSSDEDSSIIAKHLDGDFYVAAGGFDHCSRQLRVLEKIAAHEETVVRDAALKSLISCLGQMNEAEAEESIYEIFKRFSQTDWFPHKVALALLTPPLFKKLSNPDKRNDILDNFKKVIRHPMHLVRLQAYKELSDIIRAAPPKFYHSHIRLFLHHVQNETHTQGRTSLNTRSSTFNLVQVALTILETYPEKGVSASDVFEYTWPWFKSAGEDDSWRLRTEFIKSLPGICSGYATLFQNTGKDVNTEHVYPISLQILSDPEPQVREYAIGNFTKSLKYFTIEDKNDLLDRVLALANEDAQGVKEKYAEYVMSIFSAAQLNVMKLLEVINQMKQESAQPSNNIAMNLCVNLGDLVGLVMQYTGSESDAIVKVMYTFIEEWWRDTRWRIRWHIMKCMGSISTHYTDASFDDSPFKEIILKSFTDIAFEVRQESCRQIPALVESFGANYVLDQLFSVILDTFNSAQNYHFRVTLFHAIENFNSTSLSSSTFNDKFSSLLLQGLEDPVVNIRLLVCQVIATCASRLRSSDLSQTLISKLREMNASESDPDTVYFSLQAAKLLE